MDELQIQSSTPLPIPALPAARPWGFWATIGMTIVIVLGYVFAQAIGLIVYFAWTSATGATVSQKEIENSGLVLALVTLCGSPVPVGLALLFAWLRRGITVRDYLGLYWPGWQTAVRWCLVLFAFIAVTDLTRVFVLKRPLVPDVMVQI